MNYSHVRKAKINEETKVPIWVWCTQEIVTLGPMLLVAHMLGRWG